jgi:hypothetical protein
MRLVESLHSHGKTRILHPCRHALHDVIASKAYPDRAAPKSKKVKK